MRSRRSRRRHRTWLTYAAPLVVLAAVAGVGFYFLGAMDQDDSLRPVATASPAPTNATSAGETAAPVRQPERTAALPPLNLPADDAAHGSGMEWWYYSGILNTEAPSSARYSFHMAVFVANSLVKHTVMHVALTDLQTGQRYSQQSRTAGLPAKANSQGFDFYNDSWQAAGSGPKHLMKATFDGVALGLTMDDNQPVVAHRAAGSQTPGLLDFGDSGISYYYSRPRMAATGELRIGGKPAVKVSGSVWFDHQWGDFDVTRLGWNWLALHLADGSDVMVYQLFDGEGRPVTTTGTITKAGTSRPLAPGEVELTPLRRWTSPRKIEYVVDWKLRLPSGEQIVQPFVDNSEFDASNSSANIYWEGPVKVSGAVPGEGFMELSGYERLRAPVPTASK